MEKLQVVKEWSKRQAKRVKEKSTKMSFRGVLKKLQVVVGFLLL